ncbi:MAG: dipeptidase [bacterium]
MIPVFDLHCDTPLNIKKNRFNHIHPEDLKQPIFYGAIFAHFVYPKEKEPFDAGLKLVLNTIHFLKNYPDINIIDDFKKIEAKKLNIILGVEGGHIYDKNFSQFETFYELGIRVFTITWNNTNRLAHSAFDNDKKGLTKMGKNFIKMLKDYEVLVDVSHASTRTVLDICETTDNKVFASHSCIRALNPLIRNIDNKAIKAIVSRGGVVGINFSQKHLGEWRVIDHLNYLYEKFGVNSMAIGSDFDGITDPILVCPSGYKKISQELLKEDYTKKEVEKIFYKNFLQMLR